MLHIITKRLEICIDINIEISEVDHYRWIFTSRIFRLALGKPFLLCKYLFATNGLRVTLTKQKTKKVGGGVLIRAWGGGGSVVGKFFEKKWAGGTLIRDLRVYVQSLLCWEWDFS